MFFSMIAIDLFQQPSFSTSSPLSPPPATAASFPLSRAHIRKLTHPFSSEKTTLQPPIQPLHASFPKLAALFPPKDAAASLVTSLGRAVALSTIVYCVWVFAVAAVVRDDEHKGPAELAEERKKKGAKKRA